MTQKTKHTPWIIEYGSEESSIIDARGYIICTNGEDPSVASDDEMTHIVKCVNMHDELVEVLSELMKVYNEPDEEICCNGYHCGCQGASVRQQAEHYARETLKKAGAL